MYCLLYYFNVYFRYATSEHYFTRVEYLEEKQL